MSITSHYYGRTQNGEEIYQYILENAAGMRVAVIEYGCVITNIWVKDNTGELRDVALGYSKLEDYELGGVFGAFIGRYANRIEKSRFTLDGKTYELNPTTGRTICTAHLPRKCTRAASWTAAWCCGQ